MICLPADIVCRSQTCQDSNLHDVWCSLPHTSLRGRRMLIGRCWKKSETQIVCFWFLQELGINRELQHVLLVEWYRQISRSVPKHRKTVTFIVWECTFLGHSQIYQFRPTAPQHTFSRLDSTSFSFQAIYPSSVWLELLKLIWGATKSGNLKAWNML